MVVPKLSEKGYLSISLVVLIVSLAFWTGKLDNRVEKHETEIADLKKSRDESDRLVSAQLNSIAQDVATIRGKLEMMVRDDRKSRH